MGKIKKGILGGFNGRVGNVIGGSWKGIAYMRSEAQSIKNPRTQSQQSNRTLFGAVSDVVAKARQAINLGFAGDTTKKSAFNAGVQENMMNLTQGGTGFHIDGLVFSKGGLTPLSSGSMTVSDTTVTTSFEILEASTAVTNVCVVLCFEGDFIASPYIVVSRATIPAGQTSGTSTYTIPDSLDYDTVASYGFVYDESHRDASETLKLGYE